MKTIIVLWISILALSAVNSKRYELGSAHQWEVSWGNFNKDGEYFNIENLITNTQIHFDSFKNHYLKATNIGYTQTGYSYLRYQQAECKQQNIQKCDFVYLFGKLKEGFIKINNGKQKEIKFTISELEKQQQTIVLISTGSILKKDFKTIDKVCSKSQQKYACSTKSNQMFVVFLLKSTYANLNEDQQVFVSGGQKQTITNLNSELQNLVSKYYLNPQHSKITQQMLTITLDSICRQDSQYEGITHLGLCSQNKQRHQIELHYSLLVIQILLQYNYKLGSWLFENYLNFIQQKMFYSMYNEVQWISIPEHIEVTSSYMRIMKSLQQKEPKQKQNNKIRIKKVQKVLNGFINQNLLSEVNHLSEQINYRESNKLHPTLLKMLNLNWKGADLKKMGLSIYDESFTNDFYYHSNEETVSNNVGKIMWLIKLLNQYIFLFKNYGNQFQRESLEQAISLAKVVHGFSLDDPYAKNGDFYSIIKSQNMRVYYRQFGYQSFLPYIYQVTKVFPENAAKNLTTNFGLASMSPLSQKISEKFNFRGNVHTYFNYKILFKILFLSMQQKQNMRFYGPIRQIVKKHQQKIIQTYRNWTQKKDNDSFYTEWSPQGHGIKSQRFLAIVNAIFLTNMNEFDAKASVDKAKVQKKQTK